jgi:hypothetical protein
VGLIADKRMKSGFLHCYQRPDPPPCSALAMR